MALQAKLLERHNPQIPKSAQNSLDDYIKKLKEMNETFGMTEHELEKWKILQQTTNDVNKKAIEEELKKADIIRSQIQEQQTIQELEEKRRSQTKAGNDIIAEMELEAAGFSDIQKLIMELAKAYGQDLTPEMKNYVYELQQAIDNNEHYNDLVNEALDLNEKYKDPFQKRIDAIKYLNEVMATGKLTAKAYNAALNEINKGQGGTAQQHEALRFGSVQSILAVSDFQNKLNDQRGDANTPILRKIEQNTRRESRINTIGLGVA
jgi:uncharacterized phage infection (PIP) family protein YhgE